MAVYTRDEFPLRLQTLCDRGARLQPDNLLITKTSTGYAKITFQEHQVRSLQIASALQKWGVRVGDCVGSLMWNSNWHMHCYHAISCMGAVLHTLNLRLGPKDLGYTIQHANDRVIFSDFDLLALLASVDAPVLAGVELFVCCGADWVPGAYQLPKEIPAARAVDIEAFTATGSADYAWPEFPESAIHGICFTSGTTGMPKGAAYSHRSTFLHTITLCGVDQLGIRGSDVVLPFVPMFHVLSWGVPYVCLMLGTRTVLSGKYMDPDSLLDCMLDWKVVLSTGVPTVWQGLRGSIIKRGLEKVRQGLKLKTLGCGGSAPPPDLMKWFLDSLGVEFLQAWGMTETNPLGSIARRVAKYKDVNKSPDELFSNITKAGLPVYGLEVRIANPDDMDKDMPQDTPGELLIRGPTIITEYYKTSAPEKFHKGWLITGDVAKLDTEGAIVISDRSKDVIKSGGEWISSIDLENHIVSMEGVTLAAVVAVPHPRWDERPVAIVMVDAATAAGSKEALMQKMTAHCLKAFAKFQLPDDVLVWKEIPLTSTGKIDKKVIRDRLQKEGYVLPTAGTPEAKL